MAMGDAGDLAGTWSMTDGSLGDAVVLSLMSAHIASPSPQGTATISFPHAPGAFVCHVAIDAERDNVLDLRGGCNPSGSLTGTLSMQGTHHRFDGLLVDGAVPLSLHVID